MPSARLSAMVVAVAAFALAVLAQQPLAAQVAGGFTLSAKMRTAAFHSPEVPAVLVHAPAGFDAKPPLHLVVFLHGFNGCTAVLAASGPTRCRPGGPEYAGYGLSQVHDSAGTNTLLVIPQLALMRREGDPGCFARAGCFRRFLQELLSETLASQLGGARSLHDVGSVTLVAHSAGYRAALAILQHGEVSARVRSVVLMDALYGEAEAYASWLVHAPSDARLISIYLPGSKTQAGNRTLLRIARRQLGATRVQKLDGALLPPAMAPLRLLVAEGHTPHKLVPEGYLVPVLRALGLPARATP
jgi:pimeloyl-ACP methyl ester carboxylesterase